MQRLRRLYEEKENVDGSDKEVNSLTGPNYGGYAGRLRRLCGKITEVMREEKAMDRSVLDGSDNNSVESGVFLWLKSSIPRIIEKNCVLVSG